MDLTFKNRLLHNIFFQKLTIKGAAKAHTWFAIIYAIKKIVCTLTNNP